VKLQLHVPIVSAQLPGQKWKNGFFSIGLADIEETSPYTTVYSFPSMFILVLQKPTCPSGIVHLLSHIPHRRASLPTFA
jgi:hypothetical protein